jgi:hypothetical protein
MVRTILLPIELSADQITCSIRARTFSRVVFAESCVACIALRPVRTQILLQAALIERAHLPHDPTLLIRALPRAITETDSWGLGGRNFSRPIIF